MVSWRTYAAAATIAVGVYVVMPSGRLADLLYLSVGLSCVVAIVAGTRRHRPENALPWLVLAAGQACWVAGDTTFSVLDATAAGPVPFPSIADVAYLTSYPLLAAGILLLIRAQRRARDVVGLVDCAIVTAAFALLSWAFVAQPMLAASGTGTIGVTVALAYPAADIMLLALLLRLMTGQHAWSPSFLLLVAASTTSVVADTVFATEPAIGAYSVGLDTLWLVSYVLWGTAALHPDMARLTTPAPRGRSPFTAGRLVLLASATLLPVALLVGHAALGLDIDAATLVIGSAVLALLVMARMACDIDEIRATAHQRDVLRADLFDRATRDHVTGVANRPYLLQLVSSALQRGLRDGVPSALVDVRLRGVSVVLEEAGFRHRDETLRVLARRFLDVLDDGHCLARIGPDEFVVLVDRLTPEANLAALAQRLLAAVDAPLLVGDAPASITATIGISVSLDGSTDPDALLHEARVAAASTLGGGRERIEFFDASLRREQSERRSIEAGLAHAMSAGELEVHYQPVVALGTNVLDGYEALVRWNRPGHGLQAPDTFIPVAEKSDLVCELDRWVLREATRQMVAWTAEDPAASRDLTIAVNVSGRHLASDRIVTDVSDALRDSGLPPERLTVEVTETVLVDVPRASLQMSALRQLGVSVAIDDFGTGYTSIGQLGALPADILKVDRSLVTASGPGATELLELIVRAAHAYGLLVVAEGVERGPELDVLRELAFDSAQGYLIAPPLTADLARLPTRMLRPVTDDDSTTDLPL